jgi:hypothetical protein
MLEYLLFAATVALTEPATAAREGASPIVRLRHEICYALATAPAYQAKLADCLSLDRAQDATFTAHACNFLRDTDQLEDFNFPNYSGCLRDLLANGPYGSP